MKKVYFIVLFVFIFTCIIPTIAFAATNTSTPSSTPTATPTGYTITVIRDFIDYGVVDVFSTSATIAVGFITELQTSQYNVVPDYMMSITYWEEGSTEIIRYPGSLLMSYPEKMEVTFTGLKPGTKYYYQFFNEPVNTFTTSTTDTLLIENKDYQINFNINNYNYGSTVNIEIRNISNQNISNWNLKWDLIKATKILQCWCSKYTLNGTNIELSPESWNSTIPPGGSVNLGFNASDNVTIPSNHFLTTQTSINAN